MPISARLERKLQEKGDRSGEDALMSRAKRGEGRKTPDANRQKRIKEKDQTRVERADASPFREGKEKKKRKRR